MPTWSIVDEALVDGAVSAAIFALPAESRPEMYRQAAARLSALADHLDSIPAAAQTRTD